MSARDGSKSVPFKNSLPCASRHVPMFLSNLKAAVDTPSISEVYTFSDIPIVESFADMYGYKTIKRPNYMNGDTQSHYSVMKYAVDYIIEEHPDVDSFVLLLGNNCGCDVGDLTKAVDALKFDTHASAVMSVGVFNQFNPYRAFAQKDESYIETVVPQAQIPDSKSNEKDVLDKVYFFNGSFWIVRKNVFLSNSGIKPYTWLGSKVRHFEQSSYIQEIDDWWQYHLVTQFKNEDYIKGIDRHS